MKNSNAGLSNKSKFTLGKPHFPPSPLRAAAAGLVRILLAVALATAISTAEAAVVYTTLHSFQVATNGSRPTSALVQGRDGNFYGTTSSGGTNGDLGTVFRMTATGEITSLYSFTGGRDGAGPNGLVQGSDGNFYGTTYAGGTNGWGTVFRITATGEITTLYSFTSGSDGAQPQAGLVQGADGNFYGTTSYGTIFKITSNGGFTLLHSSTNASPQASLVEGSDGNFYGTTYIGFSGNGTVFRITSNGVFTSLYSFSGGNDGANPNGLVEGSDGSFYGTTANGGFTNGGWGTVFKITSNGALTSLYSFTGGNDGANPAAALVQGSDGNFYGTTTAAIPPDTGYGGTVFKITSDGAFTLLYSFTNFTDGAGLNALVQGSDGDFYGTASSGSASGSGTVFKISASGNFTNLYAFTPRNDGANPQAGLVQSSDGNFYGTTIGGGASNYGTVFKISSNGAFTSLYSFTGGNDGANPNGLMEGSDGNFYGTTAYGGVTNAGWGTVFKITSNGALTSLYAFTGGNDGANPQAGLVQSSDGNFYGTTIGGGTKGFGTVFRITATGEITTLYSFTGGSDGGNPQAGLVQGSDGNFYGTTWGGYKEGGGWVGILCRDGVQDNPYRSVHPSPFIYWQQLLP